MQLQEEIIFASHPTAVQASSIFNALENFYEEKEIPVRNILQCTTDGAPAMVENPWRFMALMKRESPGVLPFITNSQAAFNCIAYQCSTTSLTEYWSKICRQNESSLSKIWVETLCCAFPISVNMLLLKKDEILSAFRYAPGTYETLFRSCFCSIYLTMSGRLKSWICHSLHHVEQTRTWKTVIDKRVNIRLIEKKVHLVRCPNMVYTCFLSIGTNTPCVWPLCWS